MRAVKIASIAGVVTALALVAGCTSSTTGSTTGTDRVPTSAASSSLSVATPVPAPPSTSTRASRSTSRSAAPTRRSTSAAASTSRASSTRAVAPSTSHAPSRTVSPPAAPGPQPTYPPGSGPLVVLDPGHNGGNSSHIDEINRQVPAGYGRYKACNTTGTSTNAGYPEHAFTWDVALRAEQILQAHGVRVMLTRPNDTGVGPCVDQRARIQSGTGVAAAVAIHADGAAAGDHGFVVFTAAQRPEGASASTVARSSRLAAAVHDSLAARSGVTPANYYGDNGYASSTEYAGLNLSTSPTAFLEIGNMRDSGDAALQSSAAGRQRIAAAVAAGILAYLG